MDVLVGKLTAYVDASSRPASNPSASIQTPWWVASLDRVPVSGQAAARAYVGHPGVYPAQPAGQVDDARTAAAPAAVAATPRTSAQLAAIQLLRRLGATDVDAASSDAALRSACRRLLRACHPDAHPAQDAAGRAVLTARLRAVLRAREVLGLPSAAAHPGVVDRAA